MIQETDQERRKRQEREFILRMACDFKNRRFDIQRRKIPKESEEETLKWVLRDRMVFETNEITYYGERVLIQMKDKAQMRIFELMEFQRRKNEIKEIRKDKQKKRKKNRDQGELRL